MNIPTKPGFYWALWVKASYGTHAGDELTPAHDWEVVEVFDNCPMACCEADQVEKFGVNVPGVREAQWLDCFKWGYGPIEFGSPEQLTTELKEAEIARAAFSDEADAWRVRASQLSDELDSERAKRATAEV